MFSVAPERIVFSRAAEDGQGAVMSISREPLNTIDPVDLMNGIVFHPRDGYLTTAESIALDVEDETIPVDHTDQDIKNAQRTQRRMRQGKRRDNGDNLKRKRTMKVFVTCAAGASENGRDTEFIDAAMFDVTSTGHLVVPRKVVEDVCTGMNLKPIVVSPAVGVTDHGDVLHVRSGGVILVKRDDRAEKEKLLAKPKVGKWTIRGSVIDPDGETDLDSSDDDEEEVYQDSTDAINLVQLVEACQWWSRRNRAAMFAAHATRSY